MNNKIFLIINIILLSTNVWALRINRPPSLSYPITQDEVSNLNRFLEDIYNIQQGRFEMDVTTLSKTNAKNGEFWVIDSGATVGIQFKAKGNIYTLTP